MGKTETAVELLSLATVRMESLRPHERGALNIALAEIQPSLSADDFAAAVERGKTIDFQQFVMDFLAE